MALGLSSAVFDRTFPRAGAQVIGVDIAPNLLETALTRAQAEGLKIRF
jgi:2-polyprenyl-3-methyl-5-hydroxy-6-metoxy-1,4-benzoquinol methylase